MPIFATLYAPNTTLANEVLLILLIMAYSALLARAVPVKAHLVLNIATAGLTAGLGLLMGLSAADMGFANPLKGAVVGGAVSLIIITGVVAVSFLPPIKKFFVGEGHDRIRKGRLVFESAVRIPFGTALVEETLFRGVLLGLLLTNNDAWVAVLVSSVIFGLWHIWPAFDSLARNDAALQALGDKKARHALSIVAIVVITGIAGAGFSWLRLVSGSLLAPWLVHWAINASSTITSVLHGRKNTV